MAGYHTRPTMPFGRYRGVSLADIPTDYLQWLVSLADLRRPLRANIRDELHRREAESWDRHGPALHRPCPSPQLAEELIGIGLRSLTTRRHPDTATGSHEAMIELTSKADWLRAVVRRGLAA